MAIAQGNINMSPLIMDPDLKVYVDSQRLQKVSDADITAQLTVVGWSPKDIQAVLGGSSSVVPLPKNTKPINHSMWDAFQHILMFISLYVSAVSFTLILHLFVDKWLPKEALSDYSYMTTVNSFSSSLLRGYLSALIVAYPIFVYLFLLITKRTITNPTIRSHKSRKFLIYLTLIATFLIVLINVITTVYNFLNGNISINFVAHLSVTLLISSVVFGYYIYQVREDRALT